MEQKIKCLSREALQEILLKMQKFLSEEQCKKLDVLIGSCGCGEQKPAKEECPPARMSREFVDEKMRKLRSFMEQIDEEELHLGMEEYEDYSDGYWDRDWITDYYDDQGIGAGIESVIQFAKDCVDDGRYGEANELCEWLWGMSVSTEDIHDSGYDGEPADLETLAEEKIIHTDLAQFALLTLYADYQVQEAENRAEDLYLYFTYPAFWELHIEDMFRLGREELLGAEQFWEDWISLLETKSGSMETRLLREAVLYHEGLDGLIRLADKNYRLHPSLYLTVMEEYEKAHDYGAVEELGKRALEKLGTGLIIRSRTALKAAHASSFLQHTDEMMRFCLEVFRSDSTDRNLLRLFGTKEMAEQYGMKAKNIFEGRIKGEPEGYLRNEELRQNVIGDYEFYRLSFYTGDFEKAKAASKNPKSSLGWSGNFIGQGIRLFLLYLYEKPLPSPAAGAVASYVDCFGSEKSGEGLGFENEIAEECRKTKTTLFWNYFKRWKPYYPMDPGEQGRYLSWAEKIVCSRADAIVGGQHRGHYGEVAALLAVTAEIKEDRGVRGAKREMFAEYKRKFPRHSSFQAEMRRFFGQQ